MILSIIRYIKGYVRIRVAGYSPERFLNLCSHHQIYIWGLAPSGQSYEMYMSVRGFRKLKPIVRKTHTKVVITERFGLPFFIHKHRKRKLFFAGIFLCLCLVYVYSTMIWNIHFEGNMTRTDDVLLEFLETKDVTHGMRKREVDCEQIVKDIRQQYDDIVWVSASIHGSRLLIQVKENEDTIQPRETPDKEEAETPKDLVAEKDGIITSIITRAGVPLVHVGDRVKAGDVLVSGRVEVLSDAQEVVGYQYHKADADIFAQTALEYEDSIPVTYDVKTYSDIEKKQYFLKIGLYRIVFGSVKNNYKEWEFFCEEKNITLGEHFILPVAYGIKTAKPYKSVPKNHTKEEVQEILSTNFDLFCRDLEKKGVQIMENSVKIHIDENVALAKGTLQLTESIKKETDTEIIEIERNETDESLGNNN